MDQFDRPLSSDEMDRLSEILEDERMPEETLDISGLHGYLTAVIIGPRPMAPNQWLPWIFGEEDQGIPEVFDNMGTLDEFIDLTMRFYNQILGELKSEDKFTPIVYRTYVDGKENYIIEDWCFGFMRGVSISMDAWEPLLESEEGEKLMTIPFLFGTWEGIESLDDHVDQEVYETAVWALPQCVYGIMDFWNGYFSSHNKTLH